MLMHICPHQGCKEIIPIEQSYCNIHINRHKQYDKSVRYTTDKKYHKFYNSAEWRTIQSVVTYKYNSICLWSYFIENKIIPSDEVHHIESLRDNWDRRLDIDNLIPLSHAAHMLIEGEYRKGNKQKVQAVLFKLKKRYEEQTRGGI